MNITRRRPATDGRRKWTFGVLAIVSIAAMLVAIPSSASARGPIYNLKFSDRCMDAAPPLRNGSPVHLYFCHDEGWQQWGAVYRSRFSGYWLRTRQNAFKLYHCLDADRNQNWNGGRIQMWTCFIDDTENQIWHFYSDNTIRSDWNGRCIDADAFGRTSGIGDRRGIYMQMWDCWGFQNAKWFAPSSVFF
jgi:hypothetical protein